MKFTKRTYNLSLVVLIISIILLVWDGCSKDARLSAFKKEVSKFKGKEQVFVQTISKDKKTIAEQSQVILSQKNALNEDLLILNGFNKVDAQVKVITQTKYDSVYVPYNITDTIYKYKSFAFKDEYFGIYGIAKNDGILFDSVYFKNDLTLTIGNKSKGFFRKSEPIVQVKYENPYTTTTSMNNVIIQNDLKWYDKKRNWFILGAGVASFVTLFLIP